MKILAFESSCDETAAAVVEDGRRVLGSAVNSQIDMHTLYGGVVPEIASRRHTEMIVPVADEALRSAGIALSDIDAVAATCAPGLIGALLVGASFAKSLAFSLSKPFIPVHHIRAHIAANYIAFPELTPPFTALSVSGGTTILVDVKDYTDFELLGGTRDDAAGEGFDKIARVLGIGYPGGAVIDSLSKTGDPEKYRLPRAEVRGHPYDFSFSGLKTAALNIINSTRQRGEELDLPSFAASFSKAVADSLAPRAVSAAINCGRDTITAGGGVAANSFLRRELTSLAHDAGIRVFFPPLPLCGDNGAMVGAQAFYEYQNGGVSDLSQNAFACMDIDVPFSKM